MRYLVETDYLSGSWMRTEEESFAGVAAAAGAFAHLRGELPRGSRAGRRGSALSAHVYAHVPGAHLRLDVFAHSPESSDIPCEERRYLSSTSRKLGLSLNHACISRIARAVKIASGF